MDLKRINLDTITDQELREALKRFDETPGPITASTRSVYKKKLASLLEDQASDSSQASSTDQSDSKSLSQASKTDSQPETLTSSGDCQTTCAGSASISIDKPNRLSANIVAASVLFFAVITLMYMVPGTARRLLTLAIISIPAYLIYFVCCMFKRRRDREAQRVCRLVEEALELLQSPSSPQVQMPILHVRDTLLTPAERKSKSMMSLWNKAVNFVETHESRVKVEMVNIDGEDFRAWKWIGSRKL